MNPTKTPRGFDRIDFTDANGEACSIQQSSAVGDTPGAFDRPGSSMLWLGVDKPLPKVLVRNEGWKSIPLPDVSPDRLLVAGRMHLSFSQVVELHRVLGAWLDTGRLSASEE